MYVSDVQSKADKQQAHEEEERKAGREECEDERKHEDLAECQRLASRRLGFSDRRVRRRLV